MKQILKLVPLVLIIVSSACKKDELDLDKISNQIVNERNIAMPMVLGEFSIKHFIEQDTDSLLTVNGDTISLIFREDPVFTFNVSDFAEIPVQPSFNYTLSPGVDIPTTGISVIDSDLIEKDTVFTFDLNNDMRIDSVILNTGTLSLTIDNSFNFTIDLDISSTSIVSPNGTIFSETIEDIGPLESTTVNFDLSSYSVKTFDSDGSRAIALKFHPVLRNTEDEDLVNASDNMGITFRFSDLNDFTGLFGFFGYITETFDTTLSSEDILSIDLGGLDGELNVTNPKVNILYNQSIGLGSKIDLNLEVIHYDDANVSIVFPTADINYSEDYLNPDYSGTITFNQSNVSNIDELIAIPVPDELTIGAAFQVNEGEDSDETYNYALWESSMTLGLEVEVPLELRADATYLDTFDISDMIGDDVEIEIEYANLTYWFKNYFPLGFDAQLILFDSIATVRLDTIYLNSDSTSQFLEPASVDENGDVLTDEVEKHSGSIELTQSEAENLLNETTHIIVQATVQTTDSDNISSVRVGYDSKLEFQFGLDARLTYTIN